MNVLNSKFLTVFLLILSVWILFSVISIEVEKDEVKKEEAAVQAKITGISQDNKLMEGYIKNFENHEFLEKEARLRLNYKLPGEEVVFVHRDANSPKASLSEESSPVDLPNYKKWWYWLLGF
jgi:cell division protein FtsB